MRVLRFAIFAISILSLMSLTQAAHANVGQIIGTILDEKNGEPLIGASVQVEGTSIGASADIDGRYVIRNVPHGTHSLLVASVGYTPKRITEVAVTNGEPVMIDASLGEAVTELKPIEVTAERARATESSVLIKRRAAINVTDGVSAETMRKAGDSHAGDALRRVVGVSVVDGRKLVVRGMGGRYSNVVLNGSPLPSPEPEKREVPLDLFPGSLLDEVVTSKTFTPDKPGTFSGGSVDLSTREFPSGLSYSVSASRSHNSESTDKNMPSYAGGDIDWLGFDDGTRDLPDGIREGGWGRDSDPALNQELGRAFSDQWTPQSVHAPWNSNVGANIGNSFALSEDSKLGLLASLSYTNSYRLRKEVYREWAEIDPSLDLDIDRGTQSVLWGTFVNATVTKTENHKFSFKGLYNRTADDEARSAKGYNKNEDSYILDHRLRYSQRFISTGQISGEHVVSFPFASTMAWHAQLARAGYDEPDTRSIRFNLFEDENGDTTGGWVYSHYSGVHMYQNLTDDDAHVKYDWTIPIGKQSRIKTGLLYQNRTRESELLRLGFNNTPSGSPLRVGTGEEIFADTNIGSGRHQYYLQSVTFPDDQYDVNEHTMAAYAQFELPLTSRLRAVGGARHEDYSMSLHTGDRTVVNGRLLIERNNGDWMPMGSLIYNLSESMSLRGVISRTIARPEFREVAPLEYQELAVGRSTRGNPGLRSSSIVSYDLRWEFYPSPAEVVAISFFAKSFTDPIERGVINSNTNQPINSYFNAARAENLGIEFEGRKSLTFLPGKLSRLSVGGNLTLISADVSVPLNDGTSATQSRPLQGQSPWTTNLSLGYVTASGRTDASVFYNGYGKRISIIDLDGRDPWYEQPRHVVDASFGHKFWSNFSLKASVKNLFNSRYQVTQNIAYGELEGQEVVLEQYELGRTFLLGFSYGL